MNHYPIFMKNRKLAFLTAGLTVCLLSCQKEEVPVDLEAPQVSLELSGKAEKLFNMVTLTSSVTDNGDIEKVEFFLNEQSLGEDREAPFELQWDTKKVDDGKYMLKVVAHDNGGLKGEAAQDVVVKNTLMTVQVENGYIANELSEGQEFESWIFLSDKEGKVIGEARQVLDGTSLEWERPADFNSDTVYFNRLAYSNYLPEQYGKSYTYLTVYSYSGFTLDDITLAASSEPAAEERQGGAEITVENDFDSPTRTWYRTMTPYHMIGKNSLESLVQYLIAITEGRSKAFSTYEQGLTAGDNETERAKYYRFDELQAGVSYKFHTSEYTAMDETMVAIPFEYDLVYFGTEGFLGSEEESSYMVDEVNLPKSEMHEFKTFYTDAFSSFRSAFIVTQANKKYYTYLKGKVAEVYNLPDFSVSATRDDIKNIQVTGRGTYDLASTFWRHVVNNETEYSRVRRAVYFANESNVAYMMPEIPTSLLELYPQLNEKVEYEYTYVLDNKRLTSYEGIMKYWLTEERANTDNWEYSSLYIYPETEGGRLLSTKDDVTLMEENLRARGIFKD